MDLQGDLAWESVLYAGSFLAYMFMLCSVAVAELQDMN